MRQSGELQHDGEMPDALVRLTELCLSLPESTVERHAKHAGFKIRAKNFAWYLDDHHSDGKMALSVRMAPGDNAQIVEIDPVRYFLPSYGARYGWVALRLDLGEIDWDEVAALVKESYRLQAPKRLASMA